MSDSIEKVAGVHHLPLFPLPLVMLPNELLPLHIFEDRYRQMLTDIERHRKLFGVTLFEPVESFIERPPVGSIGCCAEVRESETLEDGRSNILALGVVRYRLIDYVDGPEPYLVGDVEYFEDEPEEATVLEPLANEVFALFERMAKAAFRLGGSPGRTPEIQKTDPESLSFLITAAFNFDNVKKYQLLEICSTSKRLTELKELLDQTVIQIEESADIQAVSKTNGHSKKNIGL